MSEDKILNPSQIASYTARHVDIINQVLKYNPNHAVQRLSKYNSPSHVAVDYGYTQGAKDMSANLSQKKMWASVQKLVGKKYNYSTIHHYAKFLGTGRRINETFGINMMKSRLQKLVQQPLIYKSRNERQNLMLKENSVVADYVPKYNQSLKKLVDKKYLQNKRYIAKKFGEYPMAVKSISKYYQPSYLKYDHPDTSIYKRALKYQNSVKDDINKNNPKYTESYKLAHESLKEKLHFAKVDLGSAKTLQSSFDTYSDPSNTGAINSEIKDFTKRIKNKTVDPATSYSGKLGNSARSLNKYWNKQKHHLNVLKHTKKMYSIDKGVDENQASVKYIIKQDPSLNTRLGAYVAKSKHGLTLLDKRTHKELSFNKLNQRNNQWIKQAPKIIQNYQETLHAYQPWHSTEISLYSMKKSRLFDQEIKRAEKYQATHHTLMPSTDDVFKRTQREEFHNLALAAKKYHLTAYGVSVKDGSMADNVASKLSHGLQTSSQQFKSDIFNLSKVDYAKHRVTAMGNFSHKFQAHHYHNNLKTKPLHKAHSVQRNQNHQRSYNHDLNSPTL